MFTVLLCDVIFQLENKIMDRNRFPMNILWDAGMVKHLRDNICEKLNWHTFSNTCVLVTLTNKVLADYINSIYYF